MVLPLLLIGVGAAVASKVLFQEKTSKVGFLPALTPKGEAAGIILPPGSDIPVSPQELSTAMAEGRAFFGPGMVRPQVVFTQ